MISCFQVLLSISHMRPFHKELIGIEEEMYTELGFHFKVLDMSSQDLVGRCGLKPIETIVASAWLQCLKLNYDKLLSLLLSNSICAATTWAPPRIANSTSRHGSAG